MSKWDKLLEKIGSLSKDMRFDELRKVLESYGYRPAERRQQPLYFSERRVQTGYDSKARTDQESICGNG